MLLVSSQPQPLSIGWRREEGIHRRENIISPNKFPKPLPYLRPVLSAGQRLKNKNGCPPIQPSHDSKESSPRFQIR